MHTWDGRLTYNETRSGIAHARGYNGKSCFDTHVGLLEDTTPKKEKTLFVHASHKSKNYTRTKRDQFGIFFKMWHFKFQHCLCAWGLEDSFGFLAVTFFLMWWIILLGLLQGNNGTGCDSKNRICRMLQIPLANSSLLQFQNLLEQDPWGGPEKRRQKEEKKKKRATFFNCNLLVGIGRTKNRTFRNDKLGTLEYERKEGGNIYKKTIDVFCSTFCRFLLS